MKTIAILSFILLLSATQTFAQQDPEKLLYLQKIEKYRRMKSTGATLTVLGSIMTVAGIVTLANSSYVETYNGYNYTTSTTGNPGLGALLFIGGSAGMGAGIPLWIVGSKSQHKYENRLNSLSLKLRANPNSQGFALVYRFR